MASAQAHFVGLNELAGGPRDVNRALWLGVAVRLPVAWINSHTRPPVSWTRPESREAECVKPVGAGPSCGSSASLGLRALISKPADLEHQLKVAFKLGERSM